jgi:hydroxymethylbilane synthase
MTRTFTAAVISRSRAQRVHGELCQGAIGIEIRENDHEAATLVAAIDHWNTHVAIACERGFLATLDGSCRTPISGLARVEGTRLAFRGEVLTPDGQNVWTASRTIAAADSTNARENAEAVGRDAAREILETAGDKLPRF